MSDKKEGAMKPSPTDRLEITPIKSQRGQVDVQFVFGAIVLLIIAAPLAAVASDIQTSLAATPGFSWFTGSVIALLIVAAIVAAALGIE